MNNSVVNPPSCAACGSSQIVLFESKTLTRKVGGLSQKVSALKGNQCAQCKKICLDEDSQKRYADAGDALVVQLRQSKEFVSSL